jgi:hypothetical protein
LPVRTTGFIIKKTGRTTMKRLTLLSLTCLLACGGGTENENDAGDVDPDSVDDGDAAGDSGRCPPAPDCLEGEVLGQYRLTDPEGCPSYCCTGADVSISDVAVTGTDVVEVSGTAVINDVGGSVGLDMLSAELRSVSDGTGIGTCDGIDLSGESPYSPIDFTLGCTLTAPEPCGETVEVVFSYSWHDDACIASDHDTRSASAAFTCP